MARWGFEPIHKPSGESEAFRSESLSVKDVKSPTHPKIHKKCPITGELRCWQSEWLYIPLHVVCAKGNA